LSDLVHAFLISFQICVVCGKQSWPIVKAVAATKKGVDGSKSACSFYTKCQSFIHIRIKIAAIYLKAILVNQFLTCIMND
jgi:hypothetical protein